MAPQHSHRLPQQMYQSRTCTRPPLSSIPCMETTSQSAALHERRLPCRYVVYFSILPNLSPDLIPSSPVHNSSSARLCGAEDLSQALQASFPSRLSAGIHSIHPVTSTLSNFYRSTVNINSPIKKDASIFSMGGSRSNKIPRPSTLPQTPSVADLAVPTDPSAEYAIVISMYEVYNDRIFDLLSGNAMKNKHPSVKRRALLFKSTEQSPDRKVVAGLTKIICGSFEEAMMVLETGLMERKVAGTGSNAVSSRSHGFFCVEVKKRESERKGPWSSSALTIVDLAGSERARNAKTAGATLAEAGKINESLMYLGQCMQMQADNQDGSKVLSHVNMTAHSVANTMSEPCPIPTMQTHGAALLKLVPILIPSGTTASPTPEVHHGCHRRPTQRLQRHFPNSTLLRTRS
jgi:hypothetical protein